jgi:HD-GYP domain-containing protein (c-di-GMP phosphodiesterase class II)
METQNTHSIFDKLKRLHYFCTQMAKEGQQGRLLENFLDVIIDLTHSEGGVLYLLQEDKRTLKFSQFVNKTLGIKLNDSTQIPVFHDDIHLYDGEKKVNEYNPLSAAIVRNEIINIEDIYLVYHFDFNRHKKFDRVTLYKTKSVLIIPLKDHVGKIIGVVEIYNAHNEHFELTHFTEENQSIALIVASWFSVIHRNEKLNFDFKKLFESIVQVLASAIDEKSPYTGGHCRRVPIIAMMIAEALEKVDVGPYQHFKLSAEEKYELELGALLHDCGKVTTPVHVMDKSTKLETIIDGIEIVDLKFEIVQRDLEIALLKEQILFLEENMNSSAKEDYFEKKQHLLFDAKINREDLRLDREFIRVSNVGVESMSTDDQNRVRKMATKYYWKSPYGVNIPLLSYDEVKNLTIKKGTLNPDEREVINHHATMTLSMLSQMHFPEELKRIPDIASCHHERMNGEGYPRQLKKDQMSIQSRLMGLADIFEALTAKDRPYKKGKTLSESLEILNQMRIDNHIDGDIFDIFMDAEIYYHYGFKHLDDYQIDEVDLSKITSYEPLEERRKKYIKEQEDIQYKHQQQTKTRKAA